MECPKGSPLLLIELSCTKSFDFPEGLDFHRSIMTWLFCIRHTKSKMVSMCLLCSLLCYQYYSGKSRRSSKNPVWAMNCYCLRLQFESLNKNVIHSWDIKWLVSTEDNSSTETNWKLPCKAISLVKRHEINLSFKWKIYFCLLASFILKVVLGWFDSNSKKMEKQAQNGIRIWEPKTTLKNVFEKMRLEKPTKNVLTFGGNTWRD